MSTQQKMRANIRLCKDLNKLDVYRDYRRKAKAEYDYNRMMAARPGDTIVTEYIADGVWREGSHVITEEPTQYVFPSGARMARVVCQEGLVRYEFCSLMEFKIIPAGLNGEQTMCYDALRDVDEFMDALACAGWPQRLPPGLRGLLASVRIRVREAISAKADCSVAGTTEHPKIAPLPDAERRTLQVITDGVIEEDVFSAGVVRMLWACWDLDKRVREAYGDADE